jgi:hypothetical protein
MSAPQLAEVRRIEHRACDLRRGRPADFETKRHNESVAEGLRMTGFAKLGS